MKTTPSKLVSLVEGIPFQEAFGPMNPDVNAGYDDQPPPSAQTGGASQLLDFLQQNGIDAQMGGKSEDGYSDVITLPGVGSLCVDDEYAYATAEESPNYDGASLDFSLNNPDGILDWYRQHYTHEGDDGHRGDDPDPEGHAGGY